MTLPITGIVITFNEEGDIEDCLLSIKDICSELIVVDSFSTDRTIDVVGRFTDKIFYHAFENYSRQRNWAQNDLAVGNEWVLHLDAGERVSAELAKELRMVFSGHIEADGFMIPRKTIFRGTWIRFGGHYPVYHLRIFKRNKGRCEDRLYDQHYLVKGTVARLEGSILDVIESDLSVWRQRHRKWAGMEAEELVSCPHRRLSTELEGTPIGERSRLKYGLYYRSPLFLRAAIYFFYRYLLRFGFLDGWHGFLFHFWQGFWYRMFVDYRILQLVLRRFRPGRI